MDFAVGSCECQRPDRVRPRESTRLFKDAVRDPGDEAVCHIGEPSWSVGVLQINFTVPAGAETGKQPVVVSVGGLAGAPAYLTVGQ